MMGGSRALVALVATLVAATPARAQSGAPSPRQQEQANELVKRAIAKGEAGEHESAVELYQQAYALIPQPILLSNIGTEYQHAQQPAEALRFFCLYLEKDPAGPLASYATTQARVVQTQLGKRGSDAEVCAAPASPRPAPEAPQPPSEAAAPAPRRDAPTPGRGWRFAGIGIGAAGLVSLGAGVVFGVKAKRISDDISEHCADQDPCPEWPADIKEREADGQRYETIQIATLIAGGALVVTGAIVFAVGRSKSHAARPADGVVLVPALSPETVGVTLRGAF